MKLLFFNILLFLVSSPLHGSFYDANEAFVQGDYQKAIQQWEALPEKSFAKYFNLGCAYEKLGDSVKAWIAWERAKQIAPYDGALKSALLRLPLTHVQQRFIPLYQTKFYADIALILFLILFWSLFFIVLKRKSKTATFFLLVIAGVALFIYQASFDLSKHCVVIRDNANLRVSPTVQATALHTLPKGMPLISAKKQGNFISVHSGSDYNGWIALDDLEYILES